MEERRSGEKQVHGDRLLQLLFGVPARGKAGVGKERVDAGNGLVGLLDVALVGNFAIVFRDGQDARGGERFERIVGVWMDAANADGKSIAQVEQGRG